MYTGCSADEFNRFRNFTNICAQSPIVFNAYVQETITGDNIKEDINLGTKINDRDILSMLRFADDIAIDC